jgi:GTPase SAR1 family protein
MSSSPQDDVSPVFLKVLVLGDHLTGKSTFLERFCSEQKKYDKKFFDYKKFTMGCDLHLKKMRLQIKDPDNTPCIQQRFDNASALNQKTVLFLFRRISKAL